MITVIHTGLRRPEHPFNGQLIHAPVLRHECLTVDDAPARLLARGPIELVFYSPRSVRCVAQWEWLHELRDARYRAVGERTGVTIAECFGVSPVVSGGTFEAVVEDLRAGDQTRGVISFELKDGPRTLEGKLSREVVCLPVYETAQADTQKLSTKLAAVEGVPWLVITSPRGWHALLEELGPPDTGDPLVRFQGRPVRLASIGPTTTREISQACNVCLQASAPSLEVLLREIEERSKE